MTKLMELAAALTSPAVTGAAIDAAIKVAVLLAFALIVTRTLRGSSAALRHSIWSAAIAGALLLPMLAVALPSWHLPLPGAEAARSLAGRLSAAVRNDEALPSSFDVTTSPATPSVAGPVAGTSGKVTTPATSEHSRVSDLPSDGRVDVTLTTAPSRALPIVLTLWTVGAFLALLPLFFGVLQLRAIGRRARDIESDALDDYAARLARTLGIRRVVRVVEGEGAATPMTWGVLHPVVLVPQGFEHWPEPRQRDVLLHELAHVARFDCLTQHLARVLCALHWYNPLAWIASRRLRIERERACDDRVLLAGARASDYADHILTIARTLRTPRVAGAAALAMARPSHLEGRLLALLDVRRPRGVVTRRRAFAVGATALLVAATVATLSPWAVRRAEAIEANAPRTLLGDGYRDRADTDTVKAGKNAVRDDSLYGVSRKLLDTLTARSRDGVRTEIVDGQRVTYGPGSEVVLNVGPKAASPKGFTLDGCTPPARRSSSATVSEGDSHMKASVKNGECEITLERDGTIGFNSTFTDITSVEPDGWVSIYDKGGSETHKLRIVSENGALARTWYVNGQQRPYDADAARWLATSLKALDRYTNFSHGARMAVVYKERGANGVLDEVATTESDYGKRSEIERLLKMTKLDQQQVERVLGFAATDMSGDYDKSQLLQALLKEKLVTPALHQKFIAAAGTITSDYD
ncbi:MAG TPA: M56 family metallopeptidase, partial [Gemmatimonadaceae bacterium]|nr:M56 family metallopeptidase [Gemmatimonadaceae bacterium]